MLQVKLVRYLRPIFRDNQTRKDFRRLHCLNKMIIEKCWADVIEVQDNIAKVQTPNKDIITVDLRCFQTREK